MLEIVTLTAPRSGLEVKELSSHKEGTTRFSRTLKKKKKRKGKETHFCFVLIVEWRLHLKFETVLATRKIF